MTRICSECRRVLDSSSFDLKGIRPNCYKKRCRECIDRESESATPKVCSTCRETLPGTLEYFYKSNKTTDDLCCQCKPCMKASCYKPGRNSGPESARKLKESRALDPTFRERNRRACAEWYRSNKERSLQRNRNWRAENPGRMNYLRSKRRELEESKGYTSADWEYVLSLYGRACLCCGSPDITIDHVIPLSKGGSNTVENLEPLCRSCNSAKHTDCTDYRPFPFIPQGMGV